MYESRLQSFAAGAGKTFLVSKIIDWVRDGLINETTDEAFAYFYCNRNEDNRRSPESILCSLVRQLSSTATPENRLHKAFRGLKTKLALEGRSPDTEVCKDVLSTLIDTYPATTIVLDAMDECEEATRGELMGALETLMENSRNPLKILISSRPNEDIKDYFQERPHIEIQATDNQGDIEDFVREKISQSKHLRALSESLKEEIMKTLFEESDGMFQWAALQILQIEELAKTSWSSENDITERLGKLPKNLRATYDEIWDMIQRKPGRGRMLAERAIQWVLSAYVPLSTAQLASAILIDPYSDDLDGSGKQLTEKAIFELCENLLTVDMELEVWRFSHLSAREYVEEHRFTPNRSDSFVGMACLRYLIIFPCTWSGHREFYDEPPEVESFSDASDISSDDEVLSSRRYRYTNRYNRLGESYEDRILRSKGQWPEENCLCMYVAGNWMFHVKLQEEVKDIDNTRLKHLLKQFFGSLQNSSRAYQAWFNMVQHLEWRYKLKFKYHHIFQCFDSSSKRSAHLEPVSSPIFGMCCLGLFQLLLDWWEDPGTNLDSCNQYGASLLSLALIFRQEPIWRYLLRQKVRVEQGSPRPLLEAVLSGSIPAVTALLEAGSKVNFVDNQYFQAHSPLEAALKSDDTKIAQLLLDHKADVNLRTPSGLPLDYALDFRRFEFASTLLKAGANISGLDEKLFEMAEHGDCEWISILIERGANPDINMRSSTPLIGAIREGHADAVKLLLKSGADVNLIVSLSGSALTAAAENHDLDIIKLLLEAGADPRLNNGHRSPLTKAVPELLTNEKDLVLSKKTIQALLDAGADLNQVVTSDGGVTALDKAARSRTGSAKSSPDQYYASLCKFLLDAGADPNIGTESRRPLHTAIWGQNMEVVKLLVEAGADLNPINSPHLNYLYEAACIASPEILPFLLRAGANANPKNAAANPLCRVVQGGDGNALSRLLEAGCDPSILLDGGYGSVLSAAAFFGRLKACKILLEPKRGVQVETETKGWFKNALMAAIAGHQWYRSRGFAWNALSPERLQIHAYAMDHQAVIRLFLRSGAAVPTPLCPRLGDLTIPVRVGDEYHLCQVAGLMHRRGKCMQWRPFLQAWAAITWHLESGLGPRLPLRLQLHRCGLVRSLPFKAMILMRFIHITQPEEAKFVLIVLRREKSDHYTWNAPVRRVASKIETPPSVKSAPKLILLPSEKLASLAQVSLLEKLSPRPNGGVGWSKQLETRRYRGSAAGLSWSMVLFIGFSALLWSWFWGGRREIPTGQEF